jgi:putative transposase
VLGVSRTGYCQRRGRVPSTRTRANAILDVHVRQIHVGSHASYGRPRIVQALRRLGLSEGSERVRQSLRRQGLRPVYKRPYRVTTDSSHHLPVASNILNRRFDGWPPNRAWVADLTYIATAQGWLYLAVTMDLASRRIVGWSMSEWMKADLVCQALRSAYGQCRPPVGLILHSDQGSQYASYAYRRPAADFGMQTSMSRRANAWNNAAMESFFMTLKVERIYQCLARKASAFMPGMKSADAEGILAFEA